MGPFSGFEGSQALPSQDADVLVSGPDVALNVDPSAFIHADFSDCDDVPELSVGSLGDVGWGSAHGCLLARGCPALFLSRLLWIFYGFLPQSLLLSRLLRQLFSLPSAQSPI